MRDAFNVNRGCGFAALTSSRAPCGTPPVPLTASSTLVSGGGRRLAPGRGWLSTSTKSNIRMFARRLEGRQAVSRWDWGGWLIGDVAAGGLRARRMDGKRGGRIPRCPTAASARQGRGPATQWPKGSVYTPQHSHQSLAASVSSFSLVAWAARACKQQ